MSSIINKNSIHRCGISGDILAEIQRLDQSIILNWVPSHIGLTLNEEADTAAKSTTTIGHPSVYVTTSSSKLHQTVKRSCKERWIASRKFTTSFTWTTALRLTSATFKSIAKKDRTSQLQLYWLLTSTATFRQQVLKEWSCKFCGMDITAFSPHFIADCTANQRFIRTMIDLLDPSDHHRSADIMAQNIIRKQASRDFKEILAYLKARQPYP